MHFGGKCAVAIDRARKGSFHLPRPYTKGVRSRPVIIARIQTTRLHVYTEKSSVRYRVAGARPEAISKFRFAPPPPRG